MQELSKLFTSRSYGILCTMIISFRYVKELMKYIDIDSYGQCLHNKELPEKMKGKIYDDHGKSMRNKVFISDIKVSPDIRWNSFDLINLFWHLKIIMSLIT